MWISIDNLSQMSAENTWNKHFGTLDTVYPSKRYFNHFKCPKISSYMKRNPVRSVTRFTRLYSKQKYILFQGYYAGMCYMSS